MRRTGRLVCAMAVAATIATPDITLAQQAAMEPKARCEQLLAYWDRNLARRGEGATTDMTRKTAGVECDNGRYAAGIKVMEDALRQNRYPVPPPQP
jgi:hypothetical protein